LRYSVVREVKLNKPFARFFSCIPPISSVVPGETEVSVRREDINRSLSWPFSFEAVGFVGAWFGLVIGIADLAELRVARAD